MKKWYGASGKETPELKDSRLFAGKVKSGSI
jgi:hypothetical protein